MNENMLTKIASLPPEAWLALIWVIVAIAALSGIFSEINSGKYENSWVHELDDKGRRTEHLIPCYGENGHFGVKWFMFFSWIAVGLFLLFTWIE